MVPPEQPNVTPPLPDVILNLFQDLHDQGFRICSVYFFSKNTAFRQNTANPLSQFYINHKKGPITTEVTVPFIR